jgi:hypothetical protein
MYNPLEDSIPDDRTHQVHAYAKDLAYGAVEGFWPTTLTWFNDLELRPKGEHVVLAAKWQGAMPYGSLLISYGYVEGTTLTTKAFDLLNQPAPTSIFISYRRQESSAFALLILARFKALGLEPFLDLNDLEPGDEWHAELEREVLTREHFICLIGPTTLESPHVREEIAWALESDSRIIPVWHAGFDGAQHAAFEAQYPEFAAFFAKQAIQVERESTAQYHNALAVLLNRFGVTPS